MSLIGKSALVEGLRAQGRAEGLPRMAFRCSPYHTTSALYPVITHLERLLQLEPDDAPATRLAKLEAGRRPSRLPRATDRQGIGGRRCVGDRN